MWFLRRIIRRKRNSGTKPLPEAAKTKDRVKEAQFKSMRTQQDRPTHRKRVLPPALRSSLRTDAGIASVFLTCSAMTSSNFDNGWRWSTFTIKGCKVRRRAARMERRGRRCEQVAAEVTGRAHASGKQRRAGRPAASADSGRRQWTPARGEKAWRRSALKVRVLTVQAALKQCRQWLWWRHDARQALSVGARIGRVRRKPACARGGRQQTNKGRGG